MLAGSVAGQDDAAALAVAFETAAAYENGDSRLALSLIEARTFASAGDAAKRAVMEQRLLALLNRGDATLACRVFVCRQLVIIGSDFSVPTLAALLRDEQLSSMARSALEVIPGPEATRALREALDDLDGDLRTGVVNSVIRREGAAAIETRPAAGDDPTANALAAARAMADAGNKDAAAAMALQVYNATPPPARHLRASALRTWAMLRPLDAADTLVDLIRGDDDYWRGTATRTLIDLRGTKPTLAIAARLADLPPEGQRRLLAALAERGDAAAGKAVAELARSDDPSVRDAALVALGDVGKPSQVSVLLEWAAAGNESAEASLLRLRGAGRRGNRGGGRNSRRVGVDSALGRAIPDASVEERVVIARMLGRRLATGQRLAITKLTVRSQPPQVRTAAYLALARITPGGSVGYIELAIDEAATPETRQAVLEAIAEQHDVHSIDLAMRWLDDESEPETGAEAARVTIAIARGANDDLERVIARNALDRVNRAHGDDEEIRALVGAATSHLDRNVGFIQTWVVAGPFRQDGLDASAMFDVAFAPEPDAGTGAAGNDVADVEWAPVSDDVIQAPGIVDLKKLLGGNDRVAYLQTVIESPRAMDVRIEIGSDDGVKVWLNDDVVHEANAMRGLTAGQDAIPASLQAGRNVLLLKITQGGGDWRACCRVRDADGFPVDGLRFGTP